MRGQLRRRHGEDEEESVFVSMTDMTVGFLFIVILLLAYFSSQYDPSKSVPLPVHEQALAERDAARAEILRLQALLARLQQTVERLQVTIAGLRKQILQLQAELAELRKPDPLETYINQSLAQRRRILEQLRDRLMRDFPDLVKIELSEESDALRFQGEGLFISGEARLRQDRIAFVEGVAARLQEILPCYTMGADASWTADCNSSFALIEAVQIEGHTDSDGRDLSNIYLSTNRANETFRIMTMREPGLISHLNFRDQPVLSVAGYGKMRPIATNDTVQGKAANRRIDLRIIMYVPVRSEEIERVRAALTDGPAAR